jgi:hypothetical protein
MEKKYKDNDKDKDKNHIKIIFNHMNYLQNESLVFENIFQNLEENQYEENSLKINSNSNSISNFNHEKEIYYLNYIMAQKEDFFRYNNSMINENFKQNLILKKAKENLDDYNYKINLAENEIKEVSKEKKLLEEKVNLNKFYNIIFSLQI